MMPSVAAEDLRGDKNIAGVGSVSAGRAFAALAGATGIATMQRAQDRYVPNEVNPHISAWFLSRFPFDDTVVPAVRFPLKSIQILASVNRLTSHNGNRTFNTIGSTIVKVKEKKEKKKGAAFV